MVLKDLLFNDSELELENLYEVHGGYLDISDSMITFDGKTWRDARDVELETVQGMIDRENGVDTEEPQGWFDAPSINDELPDVRNDSGYVKIYGTDIYTDGLSKGFTL